MSIKPALTEAEWRDDAVVTGATDAISDAVESWYRPPPGDYTVQMIDASLHRAAALALNRQPFGFTWEDVDLLRDTAENWVAVAEMRWSPSELPEARRLRAQVEAIADRIESLLPPRET